MRRVQCLLLLLFVTAGSAEERIIYRCVDAGIPTYSDMPCGPSAQVYSRTSGVIGAAPEATPAPPAVRPRDPVRQPVETPPARRLRLRKQRDAAQADAQQAECQRLQAQLGRLRSRMRAGYGVAEGERLREQQRSARARVQALRCRT